ncbi:MAG: sugar O-acetyltransferase [Clostridiales bacterium]|jgi:maltose O-acetyltransferase|nr:sugar O-acetyltransferase [Clostridiales bacterium]
MTEREKMVGGLMYDPSDAELTELRKRARLLCEAYNSTSVTEEERRGEILKELFGGIGGNIKIEPSFYCDYGGNIYVGKEFYANFNCVILDVARVEIGDNCMLAPNVGIYTATHPIDPILRNGGREYAKPVKIGDNCWLGAGCIINPGVTIGNNVVIASGAVVTKSFPDNVVIGGVPAKIIKKTDG